MSRLWLVGLAITTFLCAAIFSRTFAASGHSDAPRKLPPAEKGSAEQVTKHKKIADTETLGGKERFLTFVSTDKPIYKGGEKVYVRGVLLNAGNHKPLPDAQATNATIQIKGPKGDSVASGNVQTQDSAWGFSWEVPAEQAGGEYTALVTYPWEGHAPSERKFEIRAYRAPRLKSQITFLRDGYGPGDKVGATLDVKRAEGGVPAGAKVTVNARVDGMEINGGTATVSVDGLCSVSFDLPREIPRGEGTLALVIEDGGVVETASKTIPIVLQTVDLQIFPEGGDLIAGYPNRVYLQAKQPNGKPADLVGKLLSKGSNGVVTEFKTEHEGRGRFEFTPMADKEYFLSISEPAGIKTTYPLPAVKTQGALVRSYRDIFKHNEPVIVEVGCTSKKYNVTLSKREEEFSACKVDAGKRSDIGAGMLMPIEFAVPSEIDGVLTVTVWDENDTPLCERLIFRAPAKPLKITVKADKQQYIPGDNAELTVKATDSDGKPLSAVVGLTVTDDSVLEMIEKREQAPRLPVMMFLEPEVKDLADAHVYLDHENAKAPLATDLLLGTQGWRRFALVNLAEFIKNNGNQARRAVALKLQSAYEQEKMAMLASKEGGLGGFRHFGGRAFAAPGAMPVPVPKAAAMPQPVAMPVDAVAAPDGSQVAVRGALRNDLVEKRKADKDIARDAEGVAQKAEAKRVAAPAEEPVDQGLMAARSRARRQQSAAQSELQIVMDEANMIADRRAIAGAEGFAGDEFGEMSSLILVREFAHQVRENRQPTDRVDFAETLYWNAGIKTDATTGEAKIKFGLNDSVSTFRVFADAFSGNGALGANNIVVASLQPFYAEAKLPLEVTAGDQVLLPISLINGTSNALTNTQINVDLKGDFKLGALLKQGSSVASGNNDSSGNAAELAASSRVRWIQPISIGFENSSIPFVLSAKSGLFADRVERKLSVKPSGFPIEANFGGMIGPNTPVVHTINIPKNVVPESLVSNTAVYPTPLANMTQALERMIQDPYGCFEQTCATSYPLTMAQQYFLSHTGIEPKLIEASKQKLDAGYKRLVSYWCPDKGYEWFGENPGHEALTAFGLMHFTDMAQVREVDQNMITTTRAWLFKQRDGNGGFSRKRRALHTWIEDKDCSNAYITWSMLETGQPSTDLNKELATVKAAGEASKNSYVTALAANVLHMSGDKVEAKKLMDRLAAKQKADGSVDGITASIVGSGGEALQIEGTSLAALAWMREPQYAGNVEKSIKFLADSCKEGRYGSTQSTVLALRAIVTYDKMRARPKAPGTVRVYVDGQSIGDATAFDPKTQGAIKLPDISELMIPGEHKLELRMEGGAEMPYSMAVKYNAITPASDDACKLDLTVKAAQDKLVEGTSTEANVTVINKTSEVIPTPVAIVGLPGGLEPRHDQLKELVKKGKIDAYEVLGRDVVLYWRTLPADAKVELPLSLIAAVPGTYTGPSSRAYLYYTDEHKRWVDGMKVQISAK